MRTVGGLLSGSQRSGEVAEAQGVVTSGAHRDSDRNLSGLPFVIGGFVWSAPKGFYETDVEAVISRSPVAVRRAKSCGLPHEEPDGRWLRFPSPRAGAAIQLLR